MLGATLIWHFAVSMGLALGLALCTQPTPARVARILAGGGVAGLGSFLVRQILAPITIAFALLHGGRGGWQPFDPDRLFDHMVIGLILGLCVGLGETMLTSARMRLVLGRNEGREFALGGGLNRIGSTEGIEVPLFGATGIGPVHAQVWRQGGRWHLADASGGLSGGTRVNGQPIAGCLLHGGETIEIGPFRLRFLLRHGGEISAQVPVLPQAPAPIPVPVPVPSVTVAHRLVDPFGAVIDLADGPTLLGRDPSSKIRLTHDGLVSRLHARVVVSGSAATVEDLGSRNGTEVNGVRIAGPTPLDNGDTVRVGATTIAYRR